jgi:2-polyprenyl-6-methoxyphenol hydroxylase-like FAD-dependent oxidoreductase
VPIGGADVLVAGAGPTGLLLAGDLAATGLDVLVLERDMAPSDLSRGFVVHARTLELLDARGLADAVIATGRLVDRMGVFGPVAADLSGLPTRFPFALIAPQHQVERLLAERALAAGVRLARGQQLTGLVQDGTGVEVTAQNAAGAATAYRSAFLAGADGAGSAVRQALGVPFPGRAPIPSVMAADLRLRAEPPDELIGVARGPGLALLAPFGDGWYRVMAWDRRRPASTGDAIGLDEVRLATRRVLDTDYGLNDARWLTRLACEERLARGFGHGRVFLAGDAAHLFVPVSGEGLNAGLQDAANLSWKLAAVLYGRADPALLGSYHAERHPAARNAQRLWRRLLRPATASSSLRRRAADLASAVAAGTGSAAAAVSGLGAGYVREPGAHPMTGRRAADVPLIGGWHPRLQEALRDGLPVLLVSANLAASPELPPLLELWSGRVRVVVPATSSAQLMLVRPDGYVGWASSTDSAVRRYTELRLALNRWCGPPAGRSETAATLLMRIISYQTVRHR